MIETKVKFNNPRDVAEFVQLASTSVGKGKLKSGIIEADVKSLLGIFDCDLSRPVALVCTPELIESVKKFVVA